MSGRRISGHEHDLLRKITRAGAASPGPSDRACLFYTAGRSLYSTSTSLVVARRKGADSTYRNSISAIYCYIQFPVTCVVSYSNGPAGLDSKGQCTDEEQKTGILGI